MPTIAGKRGPGREEYPERTLHLTMQSEEKGIEFGTGNIFHIGSEVAGQGLYLHL